MKKIISLALIALVTATVPVLAAPPAPKIVVIDRGALLQVSKVGRDIARQLQALTNQTRSSLEAQQKSLAAEGQSLRQQVAMLSADARKQKEDAFNAKARNAQEGAERRQMQVQQAAGAAQQAVAKALEPVIDDIVKARGANMVIDKSAVIYATSNAFDITGEAIAKLDAQMPAYKVVLGAQPAKQ
jgi:Skp family chaperone for outer membrane proteins